MGDVTDERVETVAIAIAMALDGWDNAPDTREQAEEHEWAIGVGARVISRDEYRYAAKAALAA